MIKRTNKIKDRLPVYKQSLSNNLFARYYENTMVDGVGVRNSLYVSGCLFNCVGCYNKAIQDFKSGEPFTEEMHIKIIKDLEPKHIDGLTLLGGEPLLNLGILLPLVVDIKNLYGNSKTIWSWTGFRWEELIEIIKKEDEDSNKIKEFLDKIDVLVDGRFEQDKYDPSLTFRGSYNQRIIDVPKTLINGDIVLWKDGEYK